MSGALVRIIMNSRTYQLSPNANESNWNDRTSYSRRWSSSARGGDLDMQSDVLDETARFVGYPEGIRAIQIPGVQTQRPRDEEPALGDRFMKTFGKPERILARASRAIERDDVEVGFV